MLKPFLFLSLFATSATVFAQDWQTVRSHDTNYYNAGNISNNQMLVYNSLRTMWVDLARNTISGDSIFYFFKCVRIDKPSQSLCQDTLAPSWLGPHMIRRSDGSELYFNSYGDTITFFTKASLGSSWILARDISGKSFRATVSYSGTANVNGATDSIKSISI